MEIYPIKTEQDYKRAIDEIDTLMDARSGTDAADRLDVLSALVEAYERRHYPMQRPADPVAVIEYQMEKRGMTRRQLETIIGGSGRISEILSRKRPLTLGMIRRLRETFGVSADVLIDSYPLAIDDTEQLPTPRGKVHI